MRVLIVHNGYQFKGGEDSVVEAEAALLFSRGHQIESFTRHNETISTMAAPTLALRTLWSTQTVREFEAHLLEFKPEIVHVHNTFPLISPAVYWTAEKHGVPIVQTLHNFRLLCPQAMFLREQQMCEDCLGKVPWRGAVRGCYRDSVLQSTVLASMITFHRAIGTWKNKVTRYIALNEFCRNKFIQGGLPADRMVVKPNFSDFERPEKTARKDFLFIGRLSAEKGLSVLSCAASLLGGLPVSVRVAGEGPDAHLIPHGNGIQLLGALNMGGVRQEMVQASALVIPSICNESFPRTLVEAFGSALPVIASRIGALAELVTDGVTGLLFEPGNANDLANKIQWAYNHPDTMIKMGYKAREQFEARYTAERNYQQLLMIYNDAIQTTKLSIG